MRYITSYRRSAALLAIVFAAVCVQVRGHHRASHDKCEEYRSWASSNLGNCDRPDSLTFPNDVRVGDYPHLAYIGWKNQDDSQKLQFLSSGSLISDRYVLTTAHSIRYELKPDVVRLGVVDLGAEDQLPSDYEVAEVIVHPNFTAFLSYNDIALVKLREPVSFSKDIRPICLWDSLQMNFTSLVTTVIGMTGDNEFPKQLDEYNLDIVNKSQCQKLFVKTRHFRRGVMDHQLCLAHTDSRQDVIRGNFGSPAQIKLYPKDCVAYVVGISSHAVTGIEIPDIYTRVASFVDWIEGIVWH